MLLHVIDVGGGWFHHMYDKNVSFELPATCDRCYHDSQDLNHWLACPGTEAARMKHFGHTKVELHALTEYPRECLALTRSTLRGAGLLPLR